jgi:hypothetical protein
MSDELSKLRQKKSAEALAEVQRLQALAQQQRKKAPRPKARRQRRPAEAVEEEVVSLSEIDEDSNPSPVSYFTEETASIAVIRFAKGRICSCAEACLMLPISQESEGSEWEAAGARIRRPARIGYAICWFGSCGLWFFMCIWVCVTQFVAIDPYFLYLFAQLKVPEISTAGSGRRT